MTGFSKKSFTSSIYFKASGLLFVTLVISCYLEPSVAAQSVLDADRVIEVSL